MNIRPGDFDDEQVQELLRLHVEGMHASSPPGTCFVLDLSGLKIPSISFFTAWDGPSLMGMGAIKELDARSGELKSMRTDPKHLRKGVGEKILLHLVSVAKSRGYSRVSLETGTGADFEAAIKLYEKHGFVKGDKFDDYVPSDFNQFFHLDL
ncbi:MAG: GNAT family N-acetyltransferase [Micropepsaceae bacterium]